MPTRKSLRSVVVLLAVTLIAEVGSAHQQLPPSEAEGGSAVAEQDPTVAEEARRKASDLANGIATRVDETAKKVDEDPRAKELSAGILNPIYRLAEHFSFSSFHWLAFALMVAGVVGFAGQLVLGKLVMLAKRHLSVLEIASDGLGFLISLVGLVLTTQAAAENSQFTSSPFAVLSATGVGAVVGFIMYLQGQSQEKKAARVDQ